MKVTVTALPGVLLLEPRVFEDERGFFMESFNARAFRQATGVDLTFVQDNHSRSSRHVLRGLHYQLPPMAQGKLVWVVSGEILDVVVDVRRASPTFGQWEGISLSAQTRRQLWVPPGIAHGFLVLSDFADVLYKTTEFYSSQHERAIVWNDPQLAIAWPAVEPILSVKDRNAVRFSLADVVDIPL
ncbi:MAG: dTDP-4-dehydrorhamnose 3,5-epimerase [Burkholderiales bacterium]|nr:dTDP-4-dehydrorhamnose 3,5-epimerase [Burkholderiales bacterium]